MSTRALDEHVGDEEVVGNRYFRFTYGVCGKCDSNKPNADDVTQ